MDGSVETNKKLTGKVYANIVIDNTLTKEGCGADAKATGDRFKAVEDNAKTTDASVKAIQDQIAEIVAKAESDIQGLASKYLALTGGELSGALKIKKYDNGWSTVDKNHSSSADYGTFLADTTKDGKTAKVSVSAALDLLTYTDAAGNIRNIHHAGNKPFGNYTGDGSATSRTIDTKGFGKLLLLYSSGYILFVTPKGALKVVLADGTMAWVSPSNLHYLDGKLVMASSNEAFNKASETYYYQVI